MQRLRHALRQAGAVGLSLAALVVLLGLAASWRAAMVLRDNDLAGASLEMDRRAALAEASVNTEVQRYVDALRTVAAAAGAFGDLTLDRFRAATEPLTTAQLAGATSVVFLVPVQDGQVEQTEQLWRKRGVPDLEFVVQGSGREHLFTVFVQPLDGRVTGAGGTDLSRSAEPTAALNESRRSGVPTVSDAYVFVRDRELPKAQQQLSFVFTAPVHGLPDATGQRPFLGWLLMGMRGQNFMGGVLRDTGHGFVDASLWATNAGGQTVRVATHSDSDGGDLHRTSTVQVANREWTLQLDAHTGDLRATGDRVPLGAGIGGSLVTLLLAGLILALTTGRNRAREQVVTATAELQATEQQARRQASLLNGILERISDGVGVVDEHGTFLVHNPAAKAMLGVGDDAARPDQWQRHYGIFRADGVTPFPTGEMPLVRALAGESTDKVEMVVRNAERPEGVLLSVSGRPLDVDGHRGAVAVFHDITAERGREADLTAYAGIVAHDLKNPLTVIAAHAEMAGESLADIITIAGEESSITDAAQYAGQSIYRVNAGVERMRHLIDDLLAYTTARDANVQPQPVELGPLVAQVLDDRINHLRGGRTALPDVYIGQLPAVYGDAAMLRQVMDNLLGNALKYVAPGRTPRIDISSSELPDGWVRIEVADRGIGIPDADKPFVFESFHRAHRGAAYGGTGLGLAICRRVIERHGGTISVTDNPGGGSRFAFTLPAAPSVPEVSEVDVEDHSYV